MRLESIAPEIATKFKQVNIQKQRAACLAACQFAIDATGIKFPIVIKSLEKLKRAEPLSMSEKNELDALVTTLDSEYFRLQEEAGQSKAATHNYLQVFSQARAVSSLLFATNIDTLSAAEAIYEAVSSVNDNKDLLGVVLTTLTQ